MTAVTVGAEPSTAEALRAHALELYERDRWSREQLLEHQRRELRDLVTHAVAHSSYYREALGADAAEADLSQLPTLPKHLLMQELDRIVTVPGLGLRELEDFLAGDDAGGLLRGEYHVFGTSGTTGEPGIFVYSRREFSSWIAVALRALMRAGATPGMRLAAIGAPGELHLTRKLFAAFKAGRAGSPELSVLTPLSEMVTALNAYQPEAITTYAGVAALLAEEELQGRLAIRPAIVAVGSEVLTEDAEQRILEAWGIRPFNVYAATEAPIIASASPDHVGLHVVEDVAIVEVVDELGRPVAAGVPGARVLLTNLVNRVQPLIRYELPDSVVLAAGPDPSGRPYSRIARVDGRSDDILRFPGVAGGEVAVHPYHLRAPFTTLPEVSQYQVVHRPERLRVRVVLRQSAPRETVERVRAALAAQLEVIGASPPLIEVEPVASIEREPGHGAKLKIVCSEVAST